MNILFFLTPKSEVAYVYNDYSLRQTLEKMEAHKYAAVPIINRKGEYKGTITEGDILWTIKEVYSLDLKKAEEIPITKVKRRMDNKPVHSNSNVEDLLSKALNQNFIPVIDDDDVFIGIVTRKDILQYYYNCVNEGKK